MLCTDRIGPWLECSWLGDNSNCKEPVVPWVECLRAQLLIFALGVICLLVYLLPIPFIHIVLTLNFTSGTQTTKHLLFTHPILQHQNGGLDPWEEPPITLW